MGFLWSSVVRLRSRSVAKVALFALLAIGCGRGDVAGKVTYNGKPLVWGTVQMEGSDKLVKYGNIETDGTFLVEDLPTGEAKVAVSSINPNSSDFQVRGTENRPAKPRPQIKGWFPIPAEYQDLSKAKLSYTVKRGQNTYEIDLK